MIILITGALIGGFLGWFVMKKEKDIKLTIFFIIVGLVAGSFLAGLTSIVITTQVADSSYVKTREIIVENIHLEKRLKGTFFLLFGSLEEKLYYVYKKENGTLQKIAANNVIAVKKGKKEKIIEVFKEYKNIPQKYPLFTFKRYRSDNKRYIVITSK